MIANEYVIWNLKPMHIAHIYNKAVKRGQEIAYANAASRLDGRRVEMKSSSG